MAANTKPIFALVPETRRELITATTTDKSGATATNLVTLVTGATDGTKISGLGFKFVGTSTAGLFLIFITDTAGANPRLYDEIAYAAVTSSATVATVRGWQTYADLQLKAGQLLIVGATTTNTNIIALAHTGNF